MHYIIFDRQTHTHIHIYTHTYIHNTHKLTLFFISMFARASNRMRATSVWPSADAHIRAVLPHYYYIYVCICMYIGIEGVQWGMRGIVL